VRTALILAVLDKESNFGKIMVNVIIRKL